MAFPLLILVLAASAVVWVVDSRTRLIEGSYEIGRLRSELEDLEMRNRQLRLEISSLSQPVDLERTIQKLGLQPPTPEHLSFIPPRGADLFSGSGS